MRNRRKFTGRQRVQIVLEGLQGDTSVAEVCRRHAMSSTLYYRWRDQLFENADRLFEKKGKRSEELDDLETENRRLKEVIAEITSENLDLRKTPGAWRITPPFRAGRWSRSGSFRRRRAHPGPPLPILPEPTGTWTADFKGKFRTQDGKLCFPLTVQDGYSRFLRECRALLSTDVQATMRRFRHLFREFGLPQRIRTNNGPPCASTAIAGLSQLSVWWISLGVIPELIEPGSHASTSSAESITTSAPTKP